MLGWRIDVWRQVDDSACQVRGRMGFIVGWEATLSGLEWLDALVAKGEAVSVGGDGYPLKYEATASVITAQLTPAPGDHSGPMTVGKEFALPHGWTGNFKIDPAEFAKCSPDERLTIEAWDLS